MFTNAVFKATGARIRRLPLTPATVLAALKKKINSSPFS
jgi:CO/xanthine dehydrogenase Mo-binding subunit